MLRIRSLAHARMGDHRDESLREPGWIYYHGHRVGVMALRLAEELGLSIERDVLYTAGLLHDIGKDEDPHNQAGARIAGELLPGLAAPEQISEISHLIRAHNERDVDHSAPARALQDADTLDHVGAIGMWLTVYWSGSHGESMDDLMRFLDGDYVAHRKKMREELNSEPARRIYDERVALEARVIEELRRSYYPEL